MLNQLGLSSQKNERQEYAKDNKMNGWHGKGNGKYFLGEKIIEVSTN